MGETLSRATLPQNSSMEDFIYDVRFVKTSRASENFHFVELRLQSDGQFRVRLFILLISMPPVSRMSWRHSLILFALCLSDGRILCSRLRASHSACIKPTVVMMLLLADDVEDFGEDRWRAAFRGRPPQPPPQCSSWRRGSEGR